ncbi:cytochrome P450 [Karstenula rhodostoma CBS 690.94]|uniref:Cytochrome P450 n=1 Tax=Karstenula rhodostoma CBS 690.94 TaxID=1392251 RepID=A0A9P4UE07_9PLEO|nr:cytochrome P450 [Karstenula rhodostoma CBS 690.94]
MLSPLFTLPHTWKLQKCAKMLKPVVTARLQKRGESKGGSVEGDRPDAMDWAIEQGAHDPQLNDADVLTEELLHNLWPVNSAPGGLMMPIVYRLCLYREPLKKKAQAAMAEHGWSEKALSKLHMQDSFVRGINRLYPTGPVTCSRTVCDTDSFVRPLEFDGFRFKDACGENEVVKVSRHWTATAMATKNLGWGYGNHACPGRFFTVREIKLMLTKLLLEYKFSWKQDSKLGRPAPVNVEGQFVPNLSQTLLSGTGFAERLYSRY